MASPDEHVEDIKGFSKRLYKALREEERTTAEVTRLRQELDHADTESSNKIGIAQDALSDYAEAICQRLCRQVYATFPREVRDIIYVHLLPDKPWQVSRPVSITEDMVTRHNYIQWSNRYTPWHLTQAAFVGEHMVRELEEVFLRTTTFVFKNDCIFMARFRLLDYLGLGLIPAQFIVNVHVHIPCDDFDLPDPVPDPRVHQNTGCRKHPSEMAVMLENIFGFKKGSKILIDLTFHSVQVVNTSLQEWLCNEVVPLIFESLRRLNQAEYTIKLRIGSDDFVLQVADSTDSVEKLREKLCKMQDDLKRREEEQDAKHYSLWDDDIFDLPTTHAIDSSNDAVTAAGDVHGLSPDIVNLFAEESSEQNVAQEGNVNQGAEHARCNNEHARNRNESEDNLDPNNEQHDSADAAHENHDSSNDAARTSSEASNDLDARA